MLAGSWVSLRCARYLVRDDRVYPFAMAVVVGGLVGARVAHVADNWPLYSSRPQDIVAFWNGGIGTMGGEALGRIGDVINGEHHAVACAGLPWCVRYTHPDTLGQRELVHPVAAYDLLVMALIFVALLWWWRRVRGRPPEGRVYLAYLLLFGGFRVLTSLLRLDPTWLFGLQEAQVLGTLYTLAGAAGLVLLLRRSRLRSA